MGIYFRGDCVCAEADSDISRGVGEKKNCSFDVFIPFSNVEQREDRDQQD